MVSPRLLALLVAAAAVHAQAPFPDPAGVPGARILAGGGSLPPAVRQRFVELAGGPQSHIVLVPTAGAGADDHDAQDRIAASWRQEFPQATFTVVHTRDRAVADSEEFTAPLRAASGLWFGGGVQKRIADAYLGTRFERELLALCTRGGVVGGTSAGTAIQTRTMIQEGRDPPIVSQGFDLVPGAVVDQHFSQRQRLPRLCAVLGDHPGLFGIGIDESTAVEVQGRRLRVLGDGSATLVLAAGAGRPQRTLVLRSDEPADLVTWQRAARNRAGPPFPAAPMADPVVAHGALVIVGGGRLPRAVVERFVALAGGKNGKVVIVPGAAPAGGHGADPIERVLRDAGIGRVAIFDAYAPADVTAERLALLADATAVWFGGGRQWRLCDAFDGTEAIAAFAAVLARGGVIGGSSAGATIQGEFLVRGNPLGNQQEWCDGYDRGFAFLPGCAVDQHFLVRDRSADLQALIAQLPQLIGLGIDEGTAAVVQGPVLEVLGDSKLAVFDVRRADAAQQATPTPVLLEPGARWDLVQGKRLER